MKDNLVKKFMLYLFLFKIDLLFNFIENIFSTILYV